MTVLLLANIGNRDVRVDKAAPISGDVNPAWNKDASRRALGQTLLSNWAASSPHVALSIIGKALSYAREQAGQIDGIILISSDQAGIEGVDERYVDQDTCELAPVVERLLVERYAVDPAAVGHWTVKGNPADYGGMQAFFRDHLGRLRDEFPQATVFLEVSGGTPAMTSMLLTVGAAVFGVDARPVYVSEREDAPFELDLGRRSVVEALTKTIKTDLPVYAYYAAASTVRANLDLLCEFVPAEALLAVLEYAYRRQNFDLEDAWGVLERMIDLTWAERARRTADGLCEHERWWFLRESIYNAQIAFRLGRLLDFVVRVFRFAEGALRLLALELGVEFVDDKGGPDADGRIISPAWQAQHQSLIEDMAQHNIDVRYGANRVVLTGIIERLCQQGDDDAHKTALDNLERLEQVGDLRNRVIHRYHRITLELLRDTYYPKKRERKRHPPEDAVDIVRAMEAVWSAVTGQPVGHANPYDEINALCLDLIG